MRRPSILTLLAGGLLLRLFRTLSFGQRLVENLGRGIAINPDSQKVFVRTPIAGTNPADIAFELYRGTEAVASRGALRKSSRIVASHQAPLPGFFLGMKLASLPKSNLMLAIAKLAK